MRWNSFGVLACLLAAPSAQALARQDAPPPPVPANFRGRVVMDSVGIPVRGAFVELVGTVMRAVTDSTGAFEITEVPAGTYVVRVRAVGFLQEFFEIEAEDGLDLEGVIALRRVPEEVRSERREGRSGLGSRHVPAFFEAPASRFSLLPSRS